MKNAVLCNVIAEIVEGKSLKVAWHGNHSNPFIQFDLYLLCLEALKSLFKNHCLYCTVPYVIDVLC